MLAISDAELDGGDVGGNATDLVAGQQLGRHAPSWLACPPEVDMGQRLPAAVADDGGRTLWRLERLPQNMAVGAGPCP
jgi:hypothetical protein